MVVGMMMVSVKNGMNEHGFVTLSFYTAPFGG
jgi:hypothetical protein